MSDWSWEPTSRRYMTGNTGVIEKLPGEWVWESVRLGPAHTPYGHGIVGKVLTDGVYDCAFCRGKGQRPKGSNCPVCSGKGTIETRSPVVICAFCMGRGEEKPRSLITCTACKGKGVIPVREPIETCPYCSGRGREPRNKLFCRSCRGSGVITSPASVCREDSGQQIRRMYRPGRIRYMTMCNLRAITNKEIAKVKSRLSVSRKNTVSATGKVAKSSRRSVSRTDLSSTAQAKPENGIEWYQFKSDVQEKLQEQKPTLLNSATIHAITKKLIAKEWRRALGKPRCEPRLDRLLREAESWSEQRELEKKKEEVGHLLDDK